MPCSPCPHVPTPLSRRALLVGAGLTSASLGGLTACGLQAPAPEGSPGPQTTAADAIPVGSGTVFPGSQTVITQPTPGEFRAFSSICTHAGCPVTEVTDAITCRCHGSRFSLTDGSVLAGPATRPLAAKVVTVTDGTVSVAG